MSTARPRRGTWLVLALLMGLGVLAVVLKQDAPTFASILIMVVITGIVGWLVWVTRRSPATKADKDARAARVEIWGPEMRADRRRAELDDRRGSFVGGPGRAWRWHVPENWPLKSDDPPRGDPND